MPRWQYFHAVDPVDQPFSADGSLFGRRDLDGEPLNCQMLNLEGDWVESVYLAEHVVLGNDHDELVDVSPAQMVELIYRAQAETPGGRFAKLPSEPLSN